MKGNQGEIKDTPIDGDTWLKYCTNLYKKPEEQHDEASHLPKLNLRHAQRDLYLDKKIEKKEIQTILKTMKQGKCHDIHGITTELIQKGGSRSEKYLTLIFNALFNNGYFPSSWNVGIITPIYKKGDKKECSNYRTITVGDTIGKIYTTLLERRLNHWTEITYKRAKGQAGSRQGYRTTDQLFLLQQLVIATTTSVGRRRNLLWACFVDFAKAFDTVKREVMWEKLRRIGVSNKFLEAIKATYTNVRCKVKTLEGYTTCFENGKGVKQGCPLSPLLFGIYIDELEERLLEEGKEFPKLGDQAIPILGYVDDLVILNTSLEGLQQSIQILEQYCREVHLRVNEDKTKVVRFGRGKSPNMCRIMINEVEIEEVKEYTYLGVLVEGQKADIWGKAEKTMALKGMKASMALQRRCSELGLTDPILKMKLFTSLVTPVLLYGSELWSKGKSWSLVQQVENAYLRRTLGVRKSTPIPFLWQEIGELPLEVEIKSRILKFKEHIENSGDERLISHAWNAQGGEKQGAWKKMAQDLRDVIAGEDNSLEDTSEIIKLLKQKTWEEWKRMTSTKFDWYNSIKRRKGREKYFEGQMDQKVRNCITRFRCGAHWLRVETGRWKKEPPEERICRHCEALGVKEVEDETHMLKRCLRFNTIREEFHDLDFSRSTLEIVNDPRVQKLGVFLHRCEQLYRAYQV